MYSMLSIINNILNISNIEEKIKNTENVLTCLLVGFNTETPSIEIFTSLELKRKEKYKTLKQIKEIMNEYKLYNIKEIEWNPYGFKILYQR